MNEASNKWFKGRCLLIATRHGKQAAIAPVLEEALGVRCIVPHNYDTDRFGTFTGEIPRAQDPVGTARLKCETAMREYGFDLAIASEGSFGAHPAIGFVPCDDELLVLIDRRNGFEIVERELSLETNVASALIAHEAELLAFATRCGFPEHGLVLGLPGSTVAVKGITLEHELLQTFRLYRATADAVKVETDMRAMHNPTRMEVIRKAAARLARRSSTVCPACEAPGYGITEAIPGLPCEQCGLPTRSTCAYGYSCGKCGHSAQLPKQGRNKEDAAFCDYCNP